MQNQPMPNQQVRNQPVQEIFLDQVKSALRNPRKTLSDHIEFVHLVRALSHIPYIVTVDSPEVKKIKTSAVLAASSTNLKLAYELFRKRDDYRLVYNLYNEPKLLCYLVAMSYDIMRFLGAAEIALKNQEEHRRMRGFKISQAIQLAVEICLRGFAYASSRRGNQQTNQQNYSDILGICASEIADWVELWRMLSRFSTYMNLSKVEANFNVSIKKDESKDFDGGLRVEGTIHPEDGIGFFLDRGELDQQEIIDQSEKIELPEVIEQEIIEPSLLINDQQDDSVILQVA